MYHYKAFGFHIDSEFEIPQVLKETDCKSADIVIRRAEIQSSIKPDDHDYSLYSKEECHYYIDDLAYFRITDGNLIEVQPVMTDFPVNELSVYIMGSAMGAIIHQRKLLPIHGSCVTNGTQSVLITGLSGAGKSTLAAEFLEHGWKILTDDVCIVKDIDGIPMAQSSYPSQKLWQDSLDTYNNENRKSEKLYREGIRDKYGVGVQHDFMDGTAPLSLVVRLLPHKELPTELHIVEVFPAIEQFRQNTYRPFMIDPSEYQTHFQNCVTLGSKIPMVLAIRHEGEDSASILYEKICNYLNKGE